MFGKFAGVLVGIFLVLHNVKSQSCVCKCGPPGLFGTDDLCVKPAPSGPLVVRPKMLTKPTVSYPLLGSSLRGPCFRRQAIVKPAVVPRPVYLQTETQTKTCNNHNANLASAVAAAAQILAESNSCSKNDANKLTQETPQGSAVILGSGIPGVQGIDVSSAYEQVCSDAKSSVPADAVSLAIAYKQSQNNYYKKVAEDRLAYGFRKLPIEQPQQKRKVYKQVLPEENLYSLNGQVVELKPVSQQASCDSLSEEAQEELLDLAISEEAHDAPVARRPSLGDIGYAPAKVSSATFVEIPSVPVPAVAIPTPPVVPCNDGFKSGTVEYKDFSNIEQIPRIIENTSCESAEEVVKHIPIDPPTCQCNYNGNAVGLMHSFSKSSKSSSSSSSSQNGKVVLQKLCS